MDGSAKRANESRVEKEGVDVPEGRGGASGHTDRQTDRQASDVRTTAYKVNHESQRPVPCPGVYAYFARTTAYGEPVCEKQVSKLEISTQVETHFSLFLADDVKHARCTS